jgi:CheY-like chemotaxis protein
MSSSAQKTVLVVDDHAPLRTLCCLNLEPAGFRVLEAADGDEALALVAADRPDVILLDIMMPRLSGWKVASALLADESTDEIPSSSSRPVLGSPTGSARSSLERTPM